MKRNLLILSLAILFLIGCGIVSLKSDTTQIAADMSAATSGYLVGQNNLSKIPDWNAWIDKIFAFKAGDSTISWENALAEVGKITIGSPFLEMQFNKILGLLEFPELQPPALPFLRSEYLEMVQIVLSGFRDGLMAAKAEAEN